MIHWMKMLEECRIKRHNSLCLSKRFGQISQFEFWTLIGVKTSRG